MEAISRKRIGVVLVLSIIIAVFATFTLPQTNECYAASKAKITKVKKSKYYDRGYAWEVTVTCNKKCQVEMRMKKKNKYSAWWKMSAGKKRTVHTCGYKSRTTKTLQFRVVRSKDIKSIKLPAYGTWKNYE